MSDGRETRIIPFNSSVELGFRALVVLNETFPIDYSLRHLVIFDYLMVHSDDIDGGPDGLHPKTPYRSGELLVRREPLQRGLHLFCSRGLVRKHYRERGVFYGANDNSQAFLDSIDSTYFNRLTDRAKWVASNFGNTGLDTLQGLVVSNLGKWGAEFEMTSVLWSEAERD